MKTAFKIAKAELRSLFYSPIAWFLLIVFLIQCSIVYFGALDNIARQQELGGMSLQYLKNITTDIFLSPRGLFGSVMQNLYLFIPLLTMSLISRETSSGTIKLLYSSPIKVWEIIIGKYIAMMIYSLLLLAIVGLFVVSGIFHIQHVETGMLLSAMLGFYLLLLAYSAIGLFMSCLTTYQVVAAICTFVMIGILSYIGSLWQKIEFIRELTYFLSINGRTQKMLVGLITTKDVIYFLVIVYIFLGLSIFKLKAGMESKPALVKAGRYTAVVVSALLIGYFSSLPGMIGYYDATANKTRTLTPNAQKILKELGDEPLEVTAYNNLLGRYWFFGSPESYNQNLGQWEAYMRFKSNIKLKTINYYDSAVDNPWLLRSYPGKDLKEVAEKYAKSNDVNLKKILTPDEIHKIKDLRPELNRYVMELKWKGRTTWLRVFDDQMMWPGETEVSAALKRLQQAKLPKVAFLTGDLERDINKMGDREYKALTNLSTFRNSLVNQGFDVDTVSLETQDIPADISTLVVADPKIEFTPITMAKLQQYINAGGNIMIAGEPGKQALLNPLLRQLGVTLTEGTLIQESKEQSPTLVTPDLTRLAGTFSKPLAKNVEDSIKISMPGAVGLSYTAGGTFSIQPLLVTDAKTSWNRVKPLDPDMITATSSGPSSDGAISVSMSPAVSSQPRGRGGNRRGNAGTVSFSTADGDVRGPIATALSLTRKINGKEQRIIVTGDADFMSNAELQRMSMRTANFAFTTGLFSWLSYGEFPIDSSRPESKDKRVNVTMDQVDFQRIIFVWVLPAILLAFGSILLIRRKRK